MSERIFLYDTTLRDGGQTQGVDFSVADKVAIALLLDQLGIDYIEGGWPGANPTDDGFFRQRAGARATPGSAAFGMTRRAGRSAANDPGLVALLAERRRGRHAGRQERAPPGGAARRLARREPRA